MKVTTKTAFVIELNEPEARALSDFLSDVLYSGSLDDDHSIEVTAAQSFLDALGEAII